VAQHDYIISNQSGAAFRGDLNNGLAAIVSQNSGATQPSTTYAYQWWADTTTSLLKIRNAANSAWITVGRLADANLGLLALAGGSMYGALLADITGTAALPAIAFAGDPDTGIYRKSSNTVGLATAGVERIFVDSTGIHIREQGDLRLMDADSSNWVALHAPSTVAANITLTVPSTLGSADQSLVTDAAGVLSFASRSRLVRGTAVATTSGTSIDFTSIPSWVRRITVMFDGVSTNGTSPVQIQLGDSGGIETTGYFGDAMAVTGAASAYATYSSGFVSPGSIAAASRFGFLTIVNINSNTWIASGTVGDNATFAGAFQGAKNLSAALDRVRLTTVNGTDTFDAGTVNIIYED
jgi:hypothetical protein